MTERETGVLHEMARGLSNAEIGKRLYLSEATVRTHVTAILAKLGVRDRLQAVLPKRRRRPPTQRLSPAAPPE